jgi:hypothetical protein
METKHRGQALVFWCSWQDHPSLTSHHSNVIFDVTIISIQQINNC